MSSSRKYNDITVDETDIDIDCKMEKKDISLKSRNRFLNSIKNLSNKEKYGSNSKINSAPVVGLTKRDSEYESQPDTTMFPFDREAIDYERIQRECFAVEEDPDGFPYCFDTDSSVIDTDSPAYEKPYFDSPSKSYQKIKMDKYTGYPSNSDIFHQYNMIAQQESMLSSYDKDKRKSNKFDKRKSDAFTPKPNNDPMIKSVRIWICCLHPIHIFQRYTLREKILNWTAAIEVKTSELQHRFFFLLYSAVNLRFLFASDKICFFAIVWAQEICFWICCLGVSTLYFIDRFFEFLDKSFDFIDKSFDHTLAYLVKE